MSQSFPDLWRREESGRGVAPRQPEQPIARTQRRSATALAGVPLFSGFSKRQLRRLASDTDELTFGPGEAVVREGDLGETLFVVLEGEGRVERNGRKVGDVMPGDFFGELAAIDAQPRTASVIALTQLRVLRLFRRHLLAMLEEEPQVTLKLLDGIVRRLRQVDRSL
jgi:CRP/FNR family cyclic AMP-dependent transcriptional regulator